MSSTEVTLTAQQRAALETHDVSIALSAGAGCGKTFVLTRRFLGHLRRGTGDDRLRKLVAITFTERAAREMRDRIRSACREQLETCPDEEAADWLALLRDLDTARISTIHAFCASLLRSHAVDADVDPQFTVLDAGTGSAVLRRVVRDAIHDLLIDRHKDAIELARQYGLERSRDIVRSLVLQRFTVDPEQWRELTTETLTERWRNCFRHVVVPRLVGELAASPTVGQLLELLREHTPLHTEMERRRRFLLDSLPRILECDDPLTLLGELRDSAKVQGGGGKKVWPSEDVYQSVNGLFKKLREEIDRLQAKFPDADGGDVEAAAKLGLSAFRVASAVTERYAQAKRAEALLDFDDLLLGARDLLRDNTEVRRSAAAGIDFLMVDEFQDTDPVQADLVRLLCGSKLTKGKLFLVGDAKQSIYRFRRADPEVFATLREELPERGRLPLTINFRSQPAILNFVNCLFSDEMAAYEPLEAEAVQLSPTPAIEFLFAIPRPEEVSDGRRESAEDRRRREAEWIARRIRQLLDDNLPRIRRKSEQTGDVELRPVRQGDIAILFRSLSNVALYEEALRRYGLEYYLVGGRAFYAQQEIYDLANLCQAIDDVDDEISLLGVLRSPLFSLSDDTIFGMVEAAGTLAAAMQKSPPAYLAGEQRDRASCAQTVIAELRRKKDRLPLAELLQLAIEQTGYDAALLHEFLGRRKLANLRKLIEQARQFDRSGLFTIKEFVDRLRESITEETDEALAATHPEAADVIRLMTVHQSKGLEFPVVIVADMDWSRGGGRGTATFHAQLGPLLPLPSRRGETPKNLGLEVHRQLEQWQDEQETVRLFYVATTRAADHLILSAGLGLERRPSSDWLKLLARRFNLADGLPAVDPYLGRVTLGDVGATSIPEIAVHHTPPEAEPNSRTAAAAALPLDRYRERIVNAAGSALPDTYGPVATMAAAQRQFSVSQIESVDEKLRAANSSTKKRQHVPTEQADESDFAAATQLGTLVHEVLQRIDFHRPQEWQAVVDACLRKSDERVPQKMQDALQDRLVAFAADPICAELSAMQTCCREIDFLLHWPVDGDAVTVAGQIDVLASSNDGRWFVIDYKTGRAGRNDQQMLDHYELQLGLYALAAGDLIGCLPECVELVLVDRQVERVSLEVNDALLERIRTRVDAAIRTLRQK